jgi:MFS family permease
MYRSSVELEELGEAETISSDEDDSIKDTTTTSLWSWDSIAIPACYLMVGTFQGLASSVLNTYPIQIGATEAQQTTIKILRTLPASFKIIFGFISDGFPIYGYRRKYYMAIGWIVAALASFALAVLNKPSISTLSILVFVMSIGFWFADVIGDSLVAERAKYEPEEQRGQLQSLCYACRFFMLMVTVIISVVMFEYSSNQTVFFVLGLLPFVVMLPAIYLLKEEKVTPASMKGAISRQCFEIWNAVCSRAVWQPMGFVYVYNLLQISNGAWSQYAFPAQFISCRSVCSYFLWNTVLQKLSQKFFLAQSIYLDNFVEQFVFCTSVCFDIWME